MKKVKNYQTLVKNWWVPTNVNCAHQALLGLKSLTWLPTWDLQRKVFLVLRHRDGVFWAWPAALPSARFGHRAARPAAGWREAAWRDGRPCKPSSLESLPSVDAFKHESVYQGRVLNATVQNAKLWNVESPWFTKKSMSLSKILLFT